VDAGGSHIIGAATVYNLGQAGDLPVIGDWDGSGSAKIGVYRQGLWILDYIGRTYLLNGFDLIFTFGNSTYGPLIL
jgi:hypothetical protein